MSLKLFRSTGFSSILYPGEARIALHPGWLVLWVSLWVGLACNVALWRAVAALGNGLPHALAVTLFAASGCGTVLSLLGWRKTIKPTATVLLFLAALAACGIWARGLPLDMSLLDQESARSIMPPWTTVFSWQFPALMTALALLPSLWVWQVQIRRLPGQQQMQVNMLGLTCGVALLAVSAFLLRTG